MQRRQFIASGLGLLAYAGTGTTVALAADAAARRGPAGQLSAAGFSAMLRDAFTIYDSARGMPVQLVKVTQAPPSAGMRQFTLTFAGASAGALGSGTYEVEHQATGKLLMYLHASREGNDTMLYRADFNLLA